MTVETTSGVSHVSTSGDHEVENTKLETTTSGVEESKEYPADFVEKLKKEKENALKGFTSKQQRVSELEARVEEFEKQEMLKKQNYSEYIQKLEEKNKELSARIETHEAERKQATLNTSIRNELVKLGIKQEYVQDAFRLLDRDEVSFHPETGTVLGAEEAAKKFHEKYSKLGFFNSKAIGVDHRAPNGGEPISQNDLYVKELRSAKTQAEFDAIRRKYGKT